MADGITIDETLGTITLSMTGATITGVNEEAAISLDGDAAEIVVSESSVQIITDTSIVATVVRDEVAQVVTIGEQGPQGIPGEAGGSTTEYIAGETISALKAVAIIDDEAFVADSTDSFHLGRVAGIAVTSATIGNDTEVRSFGQMTDASWNWTGPILFFNSSGTLTETPPATGFSQSVARVESADTIFVDLTQPIERV